MTRIVSIDLFLETQSPTEAEVRLIKACQAGERCTLSQTRPTEPFLGNEVGADLIRFLFSGGTQNCGLHESGVWVEGAWISGQLDLRFLKGKGRLALDRCHFEKEPHLEHARLDQLSFDGCKLPGLHAAYIEVSGAVFLRSVEATSTVDLRGARIEGQLQFYGASLHGGGYDALNCQNIVVVDGLYFSNLKEVNGKVSFASAQVGDLVDDFESWDKINGKIALDGFTYDRFFRGEIDVPRRLRWLKKASGGDKKEFSPQPYTQLAKTLVSMGHNRAARSVLFEREKLLSEIRASKDQDKLGKLLESKDQTKRADIFKAWLRYRFWKTMGQISRVLVGYGHRPQLALVSAAGAVAVSALLYFLAWRAGAIVPDSDVVMTSWQWEQAMALRPDAPSLEWQGMEAGTHYETFNAGAYALDIFLPLIELGQDAAWASTTATGFGTIVWVYTWGLQLFGWLVSALGLAAITGIMQRDTD